MNAQGPILALKLSRGNIFLSLLGLLRTTEILTRAWGGPARAERLQARLLQRLRAIPFFRGSTMMMFLF